MFSINASAAFVHSFDYINLLSPISSLLSKSKSNGPIHPEGRIDPWYHLASQRRFPLPHGRCNVRSFPGELLRVHPPPSRTTFRFAAPAAFQPMNRLSFGGCLKRTPSVHWAMKVCTKKCPFRHFPVERKTYAFFFSSFSSMLMICLPS